MSLKNFHLVFITCAVALSLFVAGWAIREREIRGSLMLVAASGAMAAAAGLVMYERAFLRRWRQAGLR
jgi:hypothetical protein